MNIHSNFDFFLNVQSSFLDVLDIHLDICSISEYSKRTFMVVFELLLNTEYSFPFRDILKDIHQINSGYPGYSHEYSLFFFEYLSGYPE